jgi:hypothetical protein
VGLLDTEGGYTVKEAMQQVGCARCRGGGAIDSFQNLLAPALLDCFREKTRFISNVRNPSARATGNFGRGLYWVDGMPQVDFRT